MTIEFRKKNLLEILTKRVLGIFLFTQFLFDHTIINMATMGLLMALILLICISNKKIYFDVYFIFALALIIQSYIFSKNGVSIDPSTSMKMVKTLIVNFIFSYLLYQYVLITDSLKENIYKFGATGLIFTFIIAILSAGELFAGRLSPSINILGSTIEYNSNYTALIAGFCYLVYLYKFNFNKNKINLIFMIWLVGIILLSGSRKGLLMIAIGTCLLLYILNPQKRIRNIFTLLILTILGYWMIMNIPVFYNIAGHRLEALIDVVVGKETTDASTNTRMSYINLGWNYFIEKPYTGYGLDCFRHLKGSYGTYSHNNYIELMVSGGILSVLLYYSVRIFIILKLFISKNKDKIAKLMGIFLLLQMITEYGLVSYYDRIYIILFVFILCGYSKCKRKQYVIKFK